MRGQRTMTVRLESGRTGLPPGVREGGRDLALPGIEPDGKLIWTPPQVGTSVRIMQVEYLDDGRMNIFTIGERRFRITNITSAQPYLRGVEDPYDDTSPRHRWAPCGCRGPWAC